MLSVAGTAAKESGSPSHPYRSVCREYSPRAHCREEFQEGQARLWVCDEQHGLAICQLRDRAFYPIPGNGVGHCLMRGGSL